MGFAQAASMRPIAGAVATVGVSDRVTFLRRTYGLLGVALVGFALLTGGILHFAPEASLKASMWAMSGWTWLIVMVLFMGTGYLAQHLALNGRSRGLQLGGLALSVVAQSLLLQPLLWVVMYKFGGLTVIPGMGVKYTGMSAQAASIIMQSVVITLAIFVGLTLTVFITKKDFSFMRGILTIASFAVLGIILASALFGFTLGAVFCGFMVALMGGYILFQTSMVMSRFPPQSFVAAALMLFSTIATLFWYVLQLVMSLNDSRR